MAKTENADSERGRAYRRRIAAKGRIQFIADLPREKVKFIDQLKKRHGLRSRSQVLDQLIDLRREAALQPMT
jgi:hypothetical protein